MSGMAPVRIYHRLVRPDDVPALQVACRTLFNFDDADISLADLVESDRWLCLASVQAGSAGEEIVGFVAAAIGQVSEFTEEAPTLTSYITSTYQQLAASPAATDLFQPPTAATTAAATGSSAATTSTSSPERQEGWTTAPLAAEVVLLGVMEPFRRQGVATRLLARARSFARSKGAELMFLHVQASNAAAKQLYARQGFQTVSHLPGYYLQQLSLPEADSGTSSGLASSSSVSSIASVDGAGGGHSHGLRAALNASMARSRGGSARTGSAWDQSFHSSPDAELQAMLLDPQLAAAAPMFAAADSGGDAAASDAAAGGSSAAPSGLQGSVAGGAAAEGSGLKAAVQLLPRFGSSGSQSSGRGTVDVSNTSSSRTTATTTSSSRARTEWVELPDSPAGTGSDSKPSSDSSRGAAVVGVLLGAVGALLGLGQGVRRPPPRRGQRLKVGGEDLLVVRADDGEVYIMDEEEGMAAGTLEQQQQQRAAELALADDGSSRNGSSSRDGSSSSSNGGDREAADGSTAAVEPSPASNSSSSRSRLGAARSSQSSAWPCGDSRSCYMASQLPGRWLVRGQPLPRAPGRVGCVRCHLLLSASARGTVVSGRQLPAPPPAAAAAGRWQPRRGAMVRPQAAPTLKVLRTAGAGSRPVRSAGRSVAGL